MKALLFFVCMTIGFNSFSQKKEVYAIVNVQGKALFDPTVTIAVDFGQKTKLIADNRLRNETGELITFNSVVDALNYMGEQGWSLFDTQFIKGEYADQYNYLFKKEVETKNTE